VLRKLIICLVLLGISCGVASAQTSFYTDRALAQTTVAGIPVPVTSAIPYGSVRVCTLPLTQGSPCLPLATITDINGNPLSNSLGSNFGQTTTDVTGRFTFGCTPGANLQLQITQSASNTPASNYPFTCPSGPGAGTNLTVNNLTATGAVTIGAATFPAGTANFPTVQSAITAACAATPVGIVVVPANASYVMPTTWCSGLTVRSSSFAVSGVPDFALHHYNTVLTSSSPLTLDNMNGLTIEGIEFSFSSTGNLIFSSIQDGHFDFTVTCATGSPCFQTTTSTSHGNTSWNIFRKLNVTTSGAKALQLTSGSGSQFTTINHFHRVNVQSLAASFTNIVSFLQNCDSNHFDSLNLFFGAGTT
jgi:hypothetical protein